MTPPEDVTLETVQEGLIAVTVDGVVVSQHQREDKAISSAYAASALNPNADVRIVRSDLRVDGAVTCTPTTTSDPAPQPEPTPDPVDDPTGDSPGPPAGWRMITDRPFDALSEDGWGQIVGKPVLVNDDTAPISPPGVAESEFPAGPTTSGSTPRAGINFYRNQEKFSEVYTRMWVKVAPGFLAHPSGTTKVFWWLDRETPGGGNPLFMQFKGAGSDAMKLGFVVQNPDADVDNQLMTSDVEIVRGQWHEIEVLLRMNTGANRDGVLRAWVDGVEALSIDDVQFVGMASDHLFDEMQWAPMWGGAPCDDCEIPPNNWIRVDHLQVSIP